MKKFAMGLMLGAGLMFAVSANAEVKSFVGELIEGQFPVKVDGETIESPGIVVNGTSYLPTRTIAQLAGYDVVFDADMGVELTKKVIRPVPEGMVPQQPTVPVVEPVDPKQELNIELNRINSEIRRYTIYVSGTQTSINYAKDETVKAELQVEIDGYRARIVELEVEKAQVEAQLAQQ